MNDATGRAGAPVLETVIAPNSPGFLVTADNVMIDGFYITGADIGIDVAGASNANIVNNIIMSATDMGIRGVNADSISIARNKVVSPGVSGIQVNSSNSADIADNFVSGAG